MTTTTATLAQIRQGIADNLSDAITGCQVSPYILSNFTPPAIMIRPVSDDAVTYGMAMGEGSQNWYLLVVGYVGAVNDIGAQQNLDEWIAPAGVNSINAAIDADPTLGGIVASAQVQTCRAYQEYVRPDGSTVLGAEWVVYVVT